MKIKNGLVLKPEGLRREDLFVGNCRILSDESPGDGETIDASGLFVLPGFIDLHTHGAVGVDVNGADEEGLRKISTFFASQGVTSWQCSILTDTPENTLRTISEAVKVIEGENEGARLSGIHLEGPCLSSEYKGAMPESLLMKSVDFQLFIKYLDAAKGHITYVTLAPEIPGADELTAWLTSQGVRVALGHSGAGYDESMKCISLGASAGTHVGNAMRLFHQHDPGVFGAVMESDAYCEAICDGRHLSPASVRLFHKIKGDCRMIAITDSIMAAGMPDGNYKLGVNDVIVKGGDAKLPDGTRAGSTLTMIQALKNIMSFTGLPLEKAVKWMTENPADLMGWSDLGRIVPGNRADFTILDGDLNVVCTISGGKTVYIG